jgi:aldehyde dehydrogenase (NAD+)
VLDLVSLLPHNYSNEIAGLGTRQPQAEYIPFAIFLIAVNARPVCSIGKYDIERKASQTAQQIFKMQLNYIANAAVSSSSGKTISVIDPSDGQPYDDIQRSNAEDIDVAVRAARNCLETSWSRLSASERGRLLMRLAASVATHAEDLAQIELRDCGKPLKQARADAAALVRYFEFYAGACDKLHGDTLPYQNGFSVMTWREPHGVTGHIIPWNYPMQIFGRSVAGALAAGNVCVVKPSEDACLSVLRVAELAAEAGFPAGAINIVTGYGHEVGDALARHTGIDHISFTGSPRVGTLIQQAAAERHCPVTLELGGKSPQIVFGDVDLDDRNLNLIPTLVNAIVQNAGQTCSAGSRVLIEESIYEPLLEKLGQAFASLRVGPAGLDLDVGPLIRQSQQQRVWDFLSDAQVAGIPMVAQGQVVDEAPETGFYQAPTLLRDVPVMHRLAQEEVFGPVLCAMPFNDEDHAVELANATQYGLVAGIWTLHGARQFRMAKRVRSGQVFINNYGAGGGVELPFGGVKSSGYGREKGFEALLGFTTLKTVAVRHG